MLPVATFGSRASSPPPKKPLKAPLLKNEQHAVPQRRSSRKGGARTTAPIPDKTPASKPPGDHEPFLRVSAPKTNSSTSPLKVRKTREKKVMSPRLGNTNKSAKTNTHKHVAGEIRPQRVSLNNDPGISILLPVNSVGSAFPRDTSLTSNKPTLDFHSKDREEVVQPQQPSTSIRVASDSLQQSHADLQRKYSIRKRVFTRMLGAIQDMGKGTSFTSGVQDANPSFKRSSNDTENSEGTSPWNLDFISTSREPITTDPTEYDNDDRESLVPNSTTATPTSFQFPTNFPPSRLQPNLASPTDTIGPLCSKIPREPKAILSVAVTASPEVESFDISKAGSMWAAIQICGKMFVPEGLTTVECDKRIDLAVIIDNSKFSSVACLESACSQVMHLARLLQNPADRLVVFTTVCCRESENQESPGGCQLHNLGRPKMQSLENGLKALIQPKQNPTLHSPSFFDALVAAHNTLDSADQCNDEFIGRSIIVLTPNPTALAEVMHITPFRIHIILPGIAPFSSPPFEAFSGWWLNAGMTPIPVDFDEHCDGFYFHLRSLGDLIAYERSMFDVGQVTNVFVHIKPGKASSIEGVVGDLWYPALRPGQILSLLVKINVKALATPAQSTSSRGLNSLSRSSIDDAFAHIELMLGEVLSELLKIEVVYSHSFFPDGTSLTVHESCWLLRSDSMLGQPSPRDELWNERRRSFIRRLLAYQLSSTWPHCDGLTEFEKALRQVDFSVCENYLGLLKEELAFQKGVTTDDYFITHVELKGPPTGGSSQRSGHFSFENRHTTCSDITELGKDKRSPSADSSATIVLRQAQSGQSPNEFGVDAAQKIWRHIRKHSKTRHELDQIAAEAAGENEEIKEIKQRALKNKRSVGADTLRSLTLNINSSGDAGKTSRL